MKTLSGLLARASRWGSCRTCQRWGSGLLCAPCVALLGLQAPRCPRCALPCALPLDEPCPHCRDHPPVFDHALAAFHYAPPWAGLVMALKFQHDVALGRALSTLLASVARRRWWTPTDAPPQRPTRPLGRPRRGAPTLLLPMPLSPQRLAERGFNQSWVLAQGLSQALGLPVQRHGLLRTRHTQRLMHLDADQREAHIRGAFALTPAGRAEVAGRHVALVDDVLTTGASANEVSRVLWQAGASEVSLWVLARTPLAPDRAPDRAPAALTASGRSPACI